MSIHLACLKGDLETVRKIVVAEPDSVDAEDEHNWRPIYHAVLGRQMEVVRFLIESGCDLAAHNGSVLHYAAEVPGNKEIVSMLIAYGALEAHCRPTDDLSRQFLAALFIGNDPRVRSMLLLFPELATTVDGFGEAPIHHAARNGDTEIVRLLIQHGADFNALNERGHTVLYCAGGHGHLDTVRLLLKNHVDPNIKFTHDGKSLLEWLVQFPEDDRFNEVIQLLKEHLKTGT